MTKVLIAGGGVAGLTAAIELARGGVRPTVVEKAPDVRADGYLIALSHHCVSVARDIGVLAEIQARDMRVARSRYYSGTRCVLDLDYRRLYDPGQVPQIMRDDLQTVLYGRARDMAEFRFSDGVRRIDQAGGRAQVTFDSGLEAEYDAVIGADGLRSAVRDQVLGPDDYRLHPLGLQAAAFTCDNVLGLQNEYAAHLEPMRHSIVYTTRRNELSCILFFAPQGPVPADAAARLDYLQSVFADAPAPVREVLATRVRGVPLYMDDLMQVRARTWSSGCAAIVGDAAHCLTQLSGIGASMAMAGASALSRALLVEEPAAAGRTLERTMGPQVASLQAKTRRNAKWYVPRSGGLNILRAALLAGAPDIVWRVYFRAKYARS